MIENRATTVEIMLYSNTVHTKGSTVEKKKKKASYKNIMASTYRTYDERTSNNKDSAKDDAIRRVTGDEPQLSYINSVPNVHYIRNSGHLSL
jgi:hypothetical protein